jgi:N-methylhydantoinase A/oxoprolinase/acetone carboxylase beta subunit
LEAAVSEFHRRNEEARLIEARSQEPVVRGIRLLATGLVDQPAELVLDESAVLEPIARRRVFTGDAWHDDVPVYDGDALRPGPLVVGPALVQSRFTTTVLAPDDVARMLPNGDVLVEVAPA